MIELREFERSDIPEMAAIQQVITNKKEPQSWDGMFEHHLSESSGLGFVAVRDGSVVGFTLGTVKGESFGLRQSGWIEVVGVDPQEMGEGIGKALMDKLFESFRQHGVEGVYTSVRWDAVDMLSFFKSVGFGRSDFINLTLKL
jgi:ribosomal protein S18 acetylase RimI-like enzyme